MCNIVQGLAHALNERLILVEHPIELAREFLQIGLLRRDANARRQIARIHDGARGCHHIAAMDLPMDLAIDALAGKHS